MAILQQLFGNMLLMGSRYPDVVVNQEALMFESCYTPDDVAHVLRHRYGFPVELAACRPVVICGCHIGAVTMPMELGYRVLSLLGDPVPIVANPRDTAWTFLLATAFPPLGGGRQTRRLAEHGVVVHDRGHRVLMPVADNGFGWHWASEPLPGPLRLPTRAQVLDAVDTVVGMVSAQVCGRELPVPG
jgi:hypothetical protein